MWIQVNGKNKNSSYLIGTFYQPSSQEEDKRIWLEKFDKLLSNIQTVWFGPIVIAGDFNINLHSAHPSKATNMYLEILETYGLKQHTSKATRGNALIDHIISNVSTTITHEGVVFADTVKRSFHRPREQDCAKKILKIEMFARYMVVFHRTRDNFLLFFFFVFIVTFFP